jgi:hypothetical protein
MSDRRKRRDPPIEAIKGGYWITQARRLLRGDDKYKDTPDDHAEHFLLDGIRYIEKAIEIIHADERMFMMQPGPGMKILYEVADELHEKGREPMGFMTKRRLSWSIAAGHDELRKVLKEIGYRTITNEDFNDLPDGAGGGR